ncbi:esterase family protein [Geomicrobium sp. JCM 19055]|uniref:alpha/beta hydrolase n=1 Tax=Geomicrobium sp. JCM 19055 TaxID=1460649 RepID=UPI00045ED0B3|nr:alpha/beta hydrolase-fold protein [Geomicrobium sp. JCM 19055]GAK00940.1 putative acetyl esterase YjcH [Geomicrobium sp. JCM 19055]
MDGTVETLHLQSNLLDHEFDLHVYIPPNYHENFSYNLIITGDGQDFFKLGKVDQKVEHFILEDSGPETIVVGVPYPRVAMRRKWYAPDGEQTNDYLRFIKEELLPMLEDHYNLNQDPDSRLLMGDSLSASLALMACLTYPDTFQRAVLFSPYVDDQLKTMVTESNSLHSLKMYHQFGSDEREVKATDGRVLDFIEMNESLHELLANKLQSYDYKMIDQGNHTWFTWGPLLPEALEFHWL